MTSRRIAMECGGSGSNGGRKVTAESLQYQRSSARALSPADSINSASSGATSSDHTHTSSDNVAHPSMRASPFPETIRAHKRENSLQGKHSGLQHHGGHHANGSLTVSMIKELTRQRLSREQQEKNQLKLLLQQNQRREVGRSGSPDSTDRSESPSQIAIQSQQRQRRSSRPDTPSHIEQRPAIPCGNPKLDPCQSDPYISIQSNEQDEEAGIAYSGHPSGGATQPSLWMFQGTSHGNSDYPPSLEQGQTPFGHTAMDKESLTESGAVLRSHEVVVPSLYNRPPLSVAAPEIRPRSRAENESLSLSSPTTSMMGNEKSGRAFRKSLLRFLESDSELDDSLHSLDLSMHSLDLSRHSLDCSKHSLDRSRHNEVSDLVRQNAIYTDRNPQMQYLISSVSSSHSRSESSIPISPFAVSSKISRDVDPLDMSHHVSR